VRVFAMTDDAEHLAISSDPHTEMHFANYVLFADLGICGCGNPDSAMERIRDVLRLTPLYKGYNMPEGANYLRVDALFNGDSVGAEFFVNMLNKADLLEHGSSAMGSWITSKGERLLAALETLDYEEIQEVGLGCYIDGKLDYTHE
jgi:hypothetical protein